MGVHCFIDETKAKNYFVVAAACPGESLSDARRTLGRLVLRGQRSIHMKNESARRRGHIATTVTRLRDIGIGAVILDAGRGPEAENVGRQRAMRAVVKRAAQEPGANLVIDLERSLVAHDARTIAAATLEFGAIALSYNHQTLVSEPLLTIPDVIAWCWARGPDWRRRVAPIVVEAVEV